MISSQVHGVAMRYPPTFRDLRNLTLKTQPIGLQEKSHETIKNDGKKATFLNIFWNQIL